MPPFKLCYSSLTLKLLKGPQGILYGKRAQGGVRSRADKVKRRLVSPNLPQACRDNRQKRCTNSVAANGRYDFDQWRLNVIASSQRMHRSRHWIRTTA